MEENTMVMQEAIKEEEVTNPPEAIEDYPDTYDGDRTASLGVIAGIIGLGALVGIGVKKLVKKLSNKKPRTFDIEELEKRVEELEKLVEEKDEEPSEEETPEETETIEAEIMPKQEKRNKKR